MINYNCYNICIIRWQKCCLTFFRVFRQGSVPNRKDNLTHTMKKLNPSNGRSAAAVPGNPSSKAARKTPGVIAGRTQQPGSAKARSIPRAIPRNPLPPPVPRAVKPKAKRRATRSAPALPNQPTYDSGLAYDTPGLRYAVGDPVPPPPGGAKVRLELGLRTDADLAAFAEAHKEAMAGNPNFLTPTPSAAVFDQWLADFEAKLVELDNMKVILKNLTEQKDALRAGLQAVFTQRALYVEMASNGDPDIIATSGLPLRRPPTPVGQLPWPQNLRVELTQVNGTVMVRWMSVSSAKGYLLQCAEVVEGEPRNWQLVHTGGKLRSQQKNMLPGKTYEFRVAALGGENGQSEWSPAVSRMAA